MVSPPRISGGLLRTLAKAARTKAGSRGLYRLLRADLKIDALTNLPEECRGTVPLHVRATQGRPPRKADDARHELPGDTSWSGTSARFVAAYESDETTPSEVISRCLEEARSLAARTPSIGPILCYADSDARSEAEAATERYRTKRTRGPLDGVPFAVKEQTSVKNLPRQAGTTFLSAAPRSEDATCVARLRAAGAIVIGTTPMTEFGMSPVGQNSKRTLPKNPHSPDHIAGGSSTGSGVAVATGLVPFALGADGGGSIRIPASMNGVFGIKPTWGRISRAGDITSGSVAHLGPLASSTLDLALVLEHVGATDPADPETMFAPPIEPGSLLRALGRGVKGLRIAVDEHEWGDASKSVEKAGREALRALERDGAILVPVKLRLARFAPAIGYMSIGPEALGALKQEWANNADDMGADLQIAFGSLGEVSALDYIATQRLREGLRREIALMFADVDLMALPSTAQTAARASQAEMASGFLDARLLANLCRFAFLGNLTGLPAASCPVGLDDDSLPIGFQLMGDAWDEATVLAATAQLERSGVACAKKPTVNTDVFRRRAR